MIPVSPDNWDGADDDPDDAPPFALDIYDRCIAEGQAAYLAGGDPTNPYPPGTFEADAWRCGFDDPS